MNRQDGFSLTELMMTVAIMGILGMVGYPSYLDHVQRSNRNDARSAVSRAANDLERFFATNGTYTTDVTTTSLTIDGGEAFSDDANYKVTITAGATGNIATSYRVTATAHGSQANDSDCTTMSLDSAGTRVPTPATSRCW
ncbi:MAG: prepilin-type N-terminal cleavage/methylation domain-containing protein [Gammaproteobacteria bacterium]|nr:prepilin-type N-terminal cleavage/methylation domain-containing protein [Gammaproteobacteria bacterium]